ncbi:unnamed protein product [Rotaria sordida]|uniref:Uncharacterized protein n=1 Tax=Rotaria sordida TaxID=392033 RepID=A0A815GVR2_9BILA|nr:unnamed protein product [Rotaria sordida]CAF1598318.1 unnamed protein product [Rotaria sordida]
MVSPCWPNTAQLTLSIQCSNELILLLQRNTLPSIEQLSVTNEELHFPLLLNEGKSASGIRLCKHDLRERLDGTRLRYLLLRYLSLSDVVILLDALTMPLLENMILVDLYDYTHTSVPIITTRRQLIQWTSDVKYEPDHLVKTLQILASGRVNELRLTYFNELLNASMTLHYPSSCDLLFRHLRSLTFNFLSKSISKLERVTIIKQILDASPNLSHLVVPWEDFRECSHSYLNLRHVNLILERLYPEPIEYFNVDRLAQLAPYLCSLETSREIIKLNENLVQFIWKIIHRFDQLVYLIVNKDCLYRSKHEKQKIFEERLLAVGHNQLFNCNNIKIEFRRYDELRIWL